MHLSKILFEVARPRKYPMHSSAFFGRVQPAPDKYWKRRRLMMLSAHFMYRRRNCHSIARRALMRSLQIMHTNFFRLKQRDEDLLNELRFEAGCAELDFDGWYMKEALTRSHVHLDNAMLANLAIWEPRTFRSLVAIASTKAMMPASMNGLNMEKCGPGTDVIMQ